MEVKMSNSVQNGNKTSKSEDSTSKDALAENQTPTILDNRLGTFVQKKLGEPMNQNFRSQKTAQLQTIIGGQAPVQRAVDEEDLQTKAKPVQKVGIGENIQQPTAPIQRVADEEELQMKAAPLQRKENNTGLPDNLKLGVEKLSGESLDDVQVHRNSDQPAQMQAHAFAQGNQFMLLLDKKSAYPMKPGMLLSKSKDGSSPPCRERQDICQ